MSSDIFRRDRLERQPIVLLAAEDPAVPIGRNRDRGNPGTVVRTGTRLVAGGGHQLIFMSKKFANYNCATVQGQMNVLRRIFKDAGLELPTDRDKLANAKYWLQWAIYSGRMEQYTLDCQAVQQYFNSQANKVCSQLPLPVTHDIQVD